MLSCWGEVCVEPSDTQFAFGCEALAYFGVIGRFRPGEYRVLEHEFTVGVVLNDGDFGCGAEAVDEEDASVES